MHLRTHLAVLAAKTTLKACHLTGRPGSSLPGRTAMKIDPHIIAPLAAQVRRGIIVTCGTNGKTTTNNLLCAALEAQGFRVVSNRLGANMREGVAAALAAAADPMGRLDADYACLEVDEASSVHVLPQLRPDFMILTNLFRDQLDRYGEIDLTMKALEKAIRLAPDMTLVINGDDPLTAFLAKKSCLRFVSFGVSEKVQTVSSNEVREGRFCEECGASLQYDFYHFSQLGVYRCPSCGFHRPGIDYDASGVSLTPQLSFDLREAGAADSPSDPSGLRDSPSDPAGPQGEKPSPVKPSPVRIHAPMTGFYNIYNILAVCSVLRELGLPTDRLDEILHDFRPQFGRGEVFHIGEKGGKKVLLNLAKNPAGFNQNISAMLQDRSPKDLIIVINDNAQDGRDVSWLWDVDFDRLADETIRSITVSGLRALDMQLRLKYVEIRSERAPTVEAAIDRRLAGGCGNLYVLVNYTALYEAHKYLEKIQK
ncbi:MAG: MurT ligase domain-containing protein [Eubacteriales bacterium]|nr:MurT ligase domain-containing protein [Eubacteriales bacterium]